MQTLIIVMVTLALVLWTAAIVSIARSGMNSAGSKIVWIVFVIFFPIVGPMAYFGLKHGTVTQR